MDPRPELVNHYTGGSNVYEIPVFQRSYEWTNEKWIYLWNDIRALYNSSKFNMAKDKNLTAESALNKRTHFIGTILSRAMTPLGSGMGHKYSVIDGQQRLITIFIILAAIRDDEVGQNKKISPEDPLSVLLGREKKFPRLTVNRNDSRVFQKIVDGECKDGLLSSDASTLPGKAYMFFRWQLWLGENARQESEEELSELLPPKSGRKKDAPQIGDFLKYWPQEAKGAPYNLQLLQNCINYGLSILEIILGPEDEDDAIIFETINARGTELEKFDLIRNSFFLRLGEKAEEFFDKEWSVFQKRLDTLERPKGSRGGTKDTFIYDYLIFLGIEKVSGSKLYSKWQQFVREGVGVLGDDKDGSYFAEVIAKPMFLTSLIYPASWGVSTSVSLEQTSKKLPTAAHKLITEILQLTSGPTVPLHMVGIDNWLREKMTSDDLVKWFKKIQGAILRMVIAGEGLNTLRPLILASSPQLSKSPTLGTLSKILGEGTKNSDAHLKGLIKISGFATDENAKAVAMILRGIERQIRRDTAHPMESGVGASDWQIEHIYPQSAGGPGNEWMADITKWHFQRENYDSLKHTLGNVTALTGEGNKKAAQKSFKSKQEFFERTHLGINEDLMELKTWTPKNIQDRSSVLLTYFLQEWPEKS